MPEHTAGFEFEDKLGVAVDVVHKTPAGRLDGMRPVDEEI